MTDSAQDIWSDWLLNRRFGGDQQAMQNALQNYLYPWRDQILQHAALHEGDLLLDVGCGDGLVAFGALQKTATGRVIFSDISQDLLDYSRELSRDGTPGPLPVRAGLR
jgi:ubiquinone/menaquinone biosynthesis C-methylase UbiE